MELGMIFLDSDYRVNSKYVVINENGKKLINFSTEWDIQIMSTFFEHRNIYKGT